LNKNQIAGKPIDLEFSSNGKTAYLATSYGEIRIAGATPEISPDFEKVRFYQDVIVDFELDPKQNGYYVLDQYGAIHSNPIENTPSFPHRSPPVPASLLPYWQGQSMAKDLEIGRRGLFIYTRTGELYSIAVEPYFETYRPQQEWPYRGITAKARSIDRVSLFESNGQELVLTPNR